MATESNSGFRHAISFQSDENHLGASTSSTGVVFPGNSGMNVMNTSSGLLQARNSSASLLFDAVAGRKHHPELAFDWSTEEQYKLEKGLEKFKDESSVIKYLKIAATIPDKSARDVALRCRWLTRKRRKGEEHSKNVSYRKDKLTESSPKLLMPSDLPQHSTIYPSLMGQKAGMTHEGLSGITLHLLQQNAQTFSQISSNLSILRLQENIDLFCQTRNNITAILNIMQEMPGIMNQMPPLPVSINGELINNIFPSKTQPGIYGLPPAGIHLKQEPRN